MKLKLITTLFLIGGVFAKSSLPAVSRNAKTGAGINLYRVRKIFLETRIQGNDDLSESGMAAFARLRPDLKATLSVYGFTVVDDAVEADAVMYGGNTIGWVVVDGPPLDPPKYGFQFWLSSAKYNFKWQTEFNIRSRGTEAEVTRKGVQEAARNLFRAWKKSAKNAGIVVGDRLP